MLKTEKLFIKNNDIKLEAEYYQSNTNTLESIALLVHPHPQFGGNMYNNVVSEVYKTFIQNNVSCLRFNFRGVGRSTGNHTNGRGELSDVKVCIDFLIDEKNYEKILICGYSYGAAIGCSAVNYSEKVFGFVAISFPWDFMGLKYKELSQTEKPKLFIQGNRDDIANYDNFEENYNYYSAPKKNRIINGADHFYWGYEEQVAKAVFEFYESLFI